MKKYKTLRIKESTYNKIAGATKKSKLSVINQVDVIVTGWTKNQKEK